MDSGLKQRLIGAAVLVALAVIFLPMLVQGPAPDSGVSDVPLSMPAAPAGQYETRDLPLVTPGETPSGGAVGMESAPADADDAGVATPDANAADSDNPDAAQLADNVDASPAAVADAPASRPQPLADTTAEDKANESTATAAMLPAATAGGDYAVSFGSFSTQAAANAVVASLRTSQLPGYLEPARIDGKLLQRVRIGPYATRAEAEAARLRAAHVRDDVGARVVVLDAGTAAAPARTQTAATPKPATAPAAATTGFAVQLAAFSKPADAVALRDKLRAAGFSAFTEAVTTAQGSLTRVRVGPVADRTAADRLKAEVKARVGIDGIVRPHP